MHDNCKFHFIGETMKNKINYDALLKKNITNPYSCPCEKCGLNPGAVELESSQPICQYYEEKNHD